MRRLLPGILIGLALGSTAAWTLAIPVTFPSRAKAKLVGIVDEVGNVLFGSTPGKVEVTNFPPATASAPQVVTLFERTASGPCDGPPIDAFNSESLVISTGSYRHIALLGRTAGSGTSVSFDECYFGSEQWASFADQVPRIRAHPEHSAPTTSIRLAGAMYAAQPGFEADGGYVASADGPVLGPYFGCRYVIGCGSVRLVAYLSN